MKADIAKIDCRKSLTSQLRKVGEKNLLIARKQNIWLLTRVTSQTPKPKFKYEYDKIRGDGEYDTEI